MSFYDEIEFEDMTFHPETSLYTYPCPCGDQFEITLMDLRDGEEVAVCPSCSLLIKVIFDIVSTKDLVIDNVLTCIFRRTYLSKSQRQILDLSQSQRECNERAITDKKSFRYMRC